MCGGSGTNGNGIANRAMIADQNSQFLNNRQKQRRNKDKRGKYIKNVWVITIPNNTLK